MPLQLLLVPPPLIPVRSADFSRRRVCPLNYPTNSRNLTDTIRDPGRTLTWNSMALKATREALARSRGEGIDYEIASAPMSPAGSGESAIWYQAEPELDDYSRSFDPLVGGGETVGPTRRSIATMLSSLDSTHRITAEAFWRSHLSIILTCLVGELCNSESAPHVAGSAATSVRRRHAWRGTPVPIHVR
jgi:hypothetical protein